MTGDPRSIRFLRQDSGSRPRHRCELSIIPDRLRLFSRNCPDSQSGDFPDTFCTDLIAEYTFRNADLPPPVRRHPAGGDVPAAMSSRAYSPVCLTQRREVAEIRSGIGCSRRVGPESTAWPETPGADLSELYRSQVIHHSFHAMSNSCRDRDLHRRRPAIRRHHSACARPLSVTGTGYLCLCGPLRLCDSASEFDRAANAT